MRSTMQAMKRVPFFSTCPGNVQIMACSKPQNCN
jgi:hypothetical protein